jgi:hypothetical protein
MTKKFKTVLLIEHDNPGALIKALQAAVRNHTEIEIEGDDFSIRRADFELINDWECQVIKSSL